MGGVLHRTSHGPGRVRRASGPGAGLLHLAILLLAQAPAMAQFTWYAQDGTLTVIGYTGSGGDVRVPETTNGMPVVGIADSAFRDCVSITSMTLGSNVVTVGQSAFLGCFNLASLSVPSGLTTIGSLAFYGTAISSVTLADRVNSIGGQAFLRCQRLAAITVSPSNAVYRSSAGALLDRDMTTLLQYPAGKTGPCVLPATVTDIGDYASSSSTGLTAVTFPDATTRIGNDSFDNCTALTNVVLGTNITDIGRYAFWNCSRLPAITIPASVTGLHEGVFYECSALTGITVNASNAFYSSTDGVLFDKGRTALLQYPGGRTGAYALPAGVTQVGAHAFDACARLTDVTLGSTVTNIGDYAFCACPGLTDVIIPGGVRTLGAHVFDGCTNLTRVFFMGDAPLLGSHAFDLATNTVLYYLPATTGWDTFTADRPAVLWNPHVLAEDGFQTRGSGFGFTIAGSTNLSIVVEFSNTMKQPVWISLGTCTLTGGTCHFTDTQWEFDRIRFYRFRTP